MLFTTSGKADLILEKTGEALYRQLELEPKIQALIDKNVDKQLQVQIGNISLVINIFLQKKLQIEWKFP